MSCGLNETPTAKAFQSLLGLKGGAPQPQGELLLSPAFDFVLQEALQEFQKGPLLVQGLPMADFERVENPRQPQLFQRWQQMS